MTRSKWRQGFTGRGITTTWDTPPNKLTAELPGLPLLHLHELINKSRMPKIALAVSRTFDGEGWWHADTIINCCKSIPNERKRSFGRIGDLLSCVVVLNFVDESPAEV